ncbi:hypothetical protein KAI19_02750, partial [bacterium]|nr:hypothetical protein [bacterium]
RIIVLNSGKVVFDGESKNIFNDPDLMKRNSLSVPLSVRLSKDCLNKFDKKGTKYCAPTYIPLFYVLSCKDR